MYMVTIIFVLALINVLVIQMFYNNLYGGENRQLLGSISFSKKYEQSENLPAL